MGELLPSLAQNDGHLFWRAAARVHAALGETLPPGVDVHEYAALLSLAGGITRTQQSIASAISVSRTTVVKVAADLAAQGLVTRVRNPDDRRSYALTRTAEGAAAARRWRRHVEDLEDALTSVFTLDEREELRQMLVRISERDLAPDTPAPLLESVAFLITRVHFRMHRDFSAALAPLGIEPRHKGCLAALARVGPDPAGRAGPDPRGQRRERGADGRRHGAPRAGRAPPARDRPPHPAAPPAPRGRVRREPGAGAERRADVEPARRC